MAAAPPAPEVDVDAPAPAAEVVDVPYRQIRAAYTSETVRVYQAYNEGIAAAAVAQQRLTVPGWKATRATWIKPSFAWMMYRSGFAQKDAGQARVLAIDLHRAFFDRALERAVVNDHGPGAAPPAPPGTRFPVVVQWDPERDAALRELPYRCSARRDPPARGPPHAAGRSLQVGLQGPAAEEFASRGIARIEDVTPLARRLAALPAAERAALMPAERPYPVSDAGRSALRMDAPRPVRRGARPGPAEPGGAGAGRGGTEAELPAGGT